MRARLLALAAAVVLALPALAAAQETVVADTPWSPPRITAGWVFTPTFVFGAERDDNVTVRSDNSPDRPADTALLLHPRGELVFNGRRTHFSAGYQGSWADYQTLSQLNQYQQTGRADFRRDLTPHLSLNVRASASKVPSTEQLQIDGVPFARVGARLIDVSSGIVVHPSTRSEFGGDYSYQNVQFDRGVVDTALLQGGYSNGASGYYTFHIAPRVGIGTNYEVRDAVVANGLDRFLIQNVLGTIALRLGPTSRLSGGAGLAYLHVQSTGQTLTGPALRGEFTQLIHRAIVTASFDRSFIPSYGFGGTSRNAIASTSVMVPLAQGRLTWSGGASYRQAQPLLTNLPPDLRFKSYWLTSSVGYGLTRWLRVEGFFAGAYQDKLLDGGRVVRHRYGIQFVTTKPMRIQ